MKKPLPPNPMPLDPDDPRLSDALADALADALVAWLAPAPVFPWGFCAHAVANVADTAIAAIDTPKR